MKRLFLPALALFIGICVISAEDKDAPAGFPEFVVPGHDRQMETLQRLYLLHYPGAGPKSTLWDQWLTSPSLWPAVTEDERSDSFRAAWRRALSQRIIDPNGYVATHQHPSIAHQHGWPFPFWNQGKDTAGWHFSFKNTIGPPWRKTGLDTPDDWTMHGAVDKGIDEFGWNIRLTETNASITTPSRTFNAFESPFLQLRWKSDKLGPDADPYVSWTTPDNDVFTPRRRVHFTPASAGAIDYTMIPMYEHPLWKGRIARVRINFGNKSPGAEVCVQAFFTQYDTRHNINNQCFINGCADYFNWTHDVDFLKDNIGRMRRALKYLMTQHHGLEKKVIRTDWVGHDGRSGLTYDSSGNKIIKHGRGIGNNYWDLLPFGFLDTYATILYYDALMSMSEIELGIEAHPEWRIPEESKGYDSSTLLEHAADVKATGNNLFWNDRTGRFVACIDKDGQPHDYGLTFLNLEAVYYGFATAKHEQSIMSWINGERVVESDTSQASDIYHWRFGPRSTTKRNTNWYSWAWSSPESIPWGGQVQDGGAVLGFSYHDLMARLHTLGPDNAWERLESVIAWFDDVTDAGGYREYYKNHEGSLQGGGTPGGLGMDNEFFESVLVPQVMLDGFLGFKPTFDGFKLNPVLPRSWPSLRINNIRWGDGVFTVHAARDYIDVFITGASDRAFYIYLPDGNWKTIELDTNGRPVKTIRLDIRGNDHAFKIGPSRPRALRFKRMNGEGLQAISSSP
ncbi:MAG: hypothetical protein K9N48_06805 [Verrucomicrobia bacterium]|nr:hypothetical protein [Verrucomicrobiota bacterium]